MPEFLTLKPPQKALDELLEYLHLHPEVLEIQTAGAVGWVTAEAISAPYALPNFPRSTVDGYAVRAADTFGAGESLPAYLNVRGEVLMGSPSGFSLGAAECCLIHTGGMLPVGANAVVMVEHTQAARPGEVEVLRAVAVGDNVLHIGEDVAAGEVSHPGRCPAAAGRDRWADGPWARSGKGPPAPARGHHLERG